MTSRFIERSEKEILRKIALIVPEIKDPRLDVLFSLSRVSLSPDFSNLQCYFAVIGSEWKIGEVMDALKHAAPFIRKRLGQCVRFKKVPRIHVHYDDAPDMVSEIEQLVRQIHGESEPEDGVELDANGLPGSEESTLSEEEDVLSEEEDVLSEETSLSEETPLSEELDDSSSDPNSKD